MSTARLRGRGTVPGTGWDRARDKPDLSGTSPGWSARLEHRRHQPGLRAQELQGPDPAAVTLGQEGPAPRGVALVVLPGARAPIPVARWSSVECTLSSAHSSDACACFDVSSRRHHSSAEMLIIPLGSFLLFVMGFSLLYNIHFSS